MLLHCVVAVVRCECFVLCVGEEWGGRERGREEVVCREGRGRAVRGRKEGGERVEGVTEEEGGFHGGRNGRR